MKDSTDELFFHLHIRLIIHLLIESLTHLRIEPPTHLRTKLPTKLSIELLAYSLPHSLITHWLVKLLIHRK